MSQASMNENRFVLSDYYEKQLKDIIFQGEFRAEIFATKFRFFFLGMILIFATLGLLAGRPIIEFYYQISALFILVAYNIFVLYSLRKSGKHLKIFKFLSSFLEISLLTFVVGYTAHAQKNPSLVYAAPMIYVFFILIALASIRNSSETIVFAIAVLVVEYASLAIFFYPEMNDLNKRLIGLSDYLKPNFLEENSYFFIVSAVPMGIFLILSYMIMTGGLILYAIRNTSRTTKEQADLIFNTEKQAILEENMHLGMELEVARQIQAMVLPKKAELNKIKVLEISARMDAANKVGGDYYDVIHHEDGTVYIGIGDVTDHGLASGVVMLMTQSAFITTLRSKVISLRESLRSINSILFSNIHVRMNDIRNLTLSLFSYKNGVFTTAGQHETIMVYRHASRKTEIIDTVDNGMLVGLTESIDEFIHEKPIPLQPKDIILLYTDGATEAENPKREQFGSHRLIESLERHADLPTTDEILSAIFQDIYVFIDGMDVYDDITIMIMRKRG
ncbi:SpoIIE-like protein phosphatase domain protein [Leptospira yanagawae serovar Saopaulo str. Sao Paulo = ATCC 700523]|uniref:SpoIIE-like protein phosphatase domain protein n=1 Tax=Leptospira yanagawae serovar Saopaulo str. Sao Paulo = ATCC 700523 TaxID=1249483 RepID=A0A5E8HDB4_9LEPT|nr:PP2C family protein-serine/threonine phosphatase [Leptospira yanagawae]EOQ89214.1 SpoIIE-like protein phosphatase domain protein [Leptospira yanagawae serovar Saopaulo str. Sao Paulo = ATCC 700523]